MRDHTLASQTELVYHVHYSLHCVTLPLMIEFITAALMHFLGRCQYESK